jgi:hypothetical protein
MASFLDSPTPRNSSTGSQPDTVPPTIQFTTVNELFKQINRVVGDTLIVQGVSSTDLAKIDNWREMRRRRIRFRPRKAESETLIISIPTGPHEQLHISLYYAMYDEIVRMGLNDWVGKGTTTYRPSHGVGEGDSTGGPRFQDPEDGYWPTLVIEAGCSQTLESLRADMRWWFGASDHRVKIVLLVKLQVSQGKIILEKWLEVPEISRSGATATRGSAQLIMPRCDQVINITRAPGITDSVPNRRNPSSYNVTSGALRLEFDLLFRRQPDQGERDVIVTVPHLQQCAADVWDSAVYEGF